MGIKKLYIYIIKSFLPMLAMSFAISWFVVVMQLLWRFVDDLVGKGVDGIVFIKLMFYAAMTVVPLALVLAVLVASLMTFGNLGERLELLAMKSAGIPLYTIMKPIFITVVAVAVGLFVFQNDWMIKSQVKFWTYYFSIRNKSPELAIPEGVFYKELTGYSIYVKEKDPVSKVMRGMMIYDYKDGFSNATVIVADSGRVYATKDNSALILELYNGESFKNLRTETYADPSELIPYLREKFDTKEVHIHFDANLNMVDEEILSSQFVGKNIYQLDAYTDSLALVIDSLEIAAVQEIIASSYQSCFASDRIASSYQLEEMTKPSEESREISEPEGGKEVKSTTQSTTQASAPMISKPQGPKRSSNLSIAISAPSRYKELPKEQQDLFDLPKLVTSMGLLDRGNLYGYVADMINARQSNTFFTRTNRDENVSLIRKNLIEFYRKITYPVACIVFFFIGAPLGAIIRKGGLGTPIVTAVLFFVVYYLLDSTGMEMSREGKWIFWVGMWLPTLVLAPIGITLSYIATKDSSRLNIDSYLIALKKVLGTSTVRKVEYKEVAMETPNYLKAREDIRVLENMITAQSASPRMSYKNYFLSDSDQQARIDLSDRIEMVVNNLCNDRNYLIINKLANYPILRNLTQSLRTHNRYINMALMILVPIGLPIYLIYLYRNKAYHRDLRSTRNANAQILELLEP